MTNKSELRILQDQLLRVTDHLLKSFRRQEVLVHDLGMLSVFFHHVSLLSDDTSLREVAFDLRDVLLHRPVEDVTFRSVLADPWITAYALKAWCELDPDFHTRLMASYAPAKRFLLSDLPESHELFTGMIGWALILENKDSTASCLRRMKQDLVLIDGQWGLEASEAFSGPRSPARNGGTLNLGTPHGTVGAFLFAIRRGDFELANRLRKSLTHISRHYSAGIPAFWPSSETDAPAPTAWCYGDPMLGFALLLFAKSFPTAQESIDVKREGLEIWDRIIARTSVLSRKSDFHFCHGQSGLAQVALRCSQITDRPSLRDWAQSQLRELPEDLGAWLTAENHRNARQTSSLLSGHLGIGFVLHSLVTAKESRWDQLFLLS